MTSTALAVGLGLLTSVVGWVIGWRFLKPSVTLSPSITRRQVSASAGVHQLKIVNRRHRPANEVEVRAWLVFPERHLDGGTGVIEVPVTAPLSVALGARRPRRLRSRSLFSYPHRVCTLRFADVEDRRFDQWYERLASRVRQGQEGALEELMRTAEGSLLYVTVSASDSWSGLRVVSAVRRYSAPDLVVGYFASGTSMKVKSAKVLDQPGST